MEDVMQIEGRFLLWNVHDQTGHLIIVPFGLHPDFNSPQCDMITSMN